MTHSNAALRKVVNAAMLLAAAAGVLAVGVLAADARPDYDQPPTPDRPVRLINPSSSGPPLGWTTSPAGDRRHPEVIINLDELVHMCPRCAALVALHPEQVRRHADWHSLLAASMEDAAVALSRIEQSDDLARELRERGDG